MLGRPEAVAASVPRPMARTAAQPAAARDLPLRLASGRSAPALDLVALIISAASWVALRHDGVHVRTLRRNLALTTGAPVDS